MPSSHFDTPHGQIPHRPTPDAIFVRRVLIAVLIVGLMLALWQVSLVLILLFGGIVVAVALRNIAGPLGHRFRIPDRWALVITVLDIAAIAVGFFYFFGALAGHQFSTLIDKLPGTIDSLRSWLNGSAIGRQLMGSLNANSAAARLIDALPLAGGIMGGLGEALLMIIVGIYLAADPPIYINGVVRMFPPRRRMRVRQIIDAVGEAMRKWLYGMTLDMLLLGVMTFVGMWAVGVPLPFALAVMSGVAVFVPYIGPVIATIPGMLLALSVSPQMALYAAIVYAVVLTIEGNISQPLFQRWAVSLPPIFNLLAILAFAPLFGIWGAILATPLAVVLWVLIQKVYVEDVLDDRKH